MSRDPSFPLAPSVALAACCALFIACCAASVAWVCQARLGTAAAAAMAGLAAQALWACLSRRRRGLPRAIACGASGITLWGAPGAAPCRAELVGMAQWDNLLLLQLAGATGDVSGLGRRWLVIPGDALAGDAFRRLAVQARQLCRAGMHRHAAGPIRGRR